MAWTLEAFGGLECVWKGSLPKNFEEAEVVEVLRLLAARHLTADEILAAAKGREDHLNIWHNSERHTISAAAVTPCYVATPDHLTS